MAAFYANFRVNPYRFFCGQVDNSRQGSKVQARNRKQKMKDTIFDILTAVALGLVLCGFALAYFDVLTY